MNVFKYLDGIIKREIDALSAAGELPSGLDMSAATVEQPRDSSHGDAAANTAMVLAGQAHRPPREVADLLTVRLKTHPEIVEIEIAGPGFVNLRLSDGFWQACLRDVLEAGPEYGASDLGAGQAVNVEYVSATPTGPQIPDPPRPGLMSFTSSVPAKVPSDTQTSRPLMPSSAEKIT